MKSLAIAEKYGLPRHAVHQAYYSLLDREYEWELMPLALDQKVGTMVWSPLSGGLLTGKVRRGQPLPAGSRAADPLMEHPITELLYRVVDVLDAIALETGKTIPQIALNWVLQRPTVSTIVIGARNERQLRENLDAVGWRLTPEQIARLDAASEKEKIYPYWHQAGFTERNPLPV
jgi:aryl-alcohol dehydrogenase-like predicted oxidoreductase